LREACLFRDNLPGTIGKDRITQVDKHLKIEGTPGGTGVRPVEMDKHPTTEGADK
jgi:hypothetical protein